MLSLSLMPLLQAAEPKLVIHLLDRSGKPPTEERFWVSWSKEWRGIIKTKSLTGEDAEKLLKLLKVSLSSTECDLLSGHDPTYGIVATNAEGKIIRASLCIRSLTWVKNRKRLNIRGDAGVKNKLFAALGKEIEPPKLRKTEGAHR